MLITFDFLKLGGLVCALTMGDERPAVQEVAYLGPPSSYTHQVNIKLGINRLCSESQHRLQWTASIAMITVSSRRSPYKVDLSICCEYQRG